MTSRPWDRGGTRRLAAADGYVFPTGVRQRFAFTHPGLSREDLQAVEAAVRQWFRLAARQPRAKLAMPSVVAGDYWREFRLDTTSYDTFCGQVTGRPLRDDAGDDRGTRLVTTFRLAQQDEGTASYELPRLFRVDRDLAISGARRYLADCGGYEHCYDDEVDVVCLRHLAGSPKRRRGNWRHPGAPGGAMSGAGGGCGLGCGGGGCGS